MRALLKLKHRRFELKTSCDEYHRMFFLWMEFVSELAKNKRPVTWFTGRLLWCEIRQFEWNLGLFRMMFTKQSLAVF